MNCTMAVALFLGVGAVSLSAQEINDRPLRNATTAQLRTNARRHSYEAIRELGVRKDKGSIQLLRTIASEKDEPVSISTSYIKPAELDEIRRKDLERGTHHEAKIALGRMGESGIWEEYIVGLSSTNASWKEQCIFELGEIQDPRSIPYLIPLLKDNEAPPPDPDGASKMPYSVQAAYALRKIKPDVQQQFVDKHGGRGLLFPEDWRAWWEKNRKIEKIKSK